MNNRPPLSESIIDKFGGLSRGWSNWLTQAFECLAGWKQTFNTTLTFDFASIAAGALGSTTVTVTGARAGDGVQITPSAATTGIVYYGIVTGDNTVTIYAQNCTTGAINPASTTFRVIVFQN